MHITKIKTKITDLSLFDLQTHLLKFTWYEVRVFDVTQSMEKVWNMEWKNFSMKWNVRFRRIPNMENFCSISFHGMPWFGQMGTQNVSNLNKHIYVS